MKPLLIAIGAVCLSTCGIFGVLALVVFLDEWLQPWHKRGRG